MMSLSDSHRTQAGQTGGATTKTFPPSDHEAITKAARGIPDRTDTTPSFDDGTRTFTITPTNGAFSYYIAGRRYIKSAADSIVIADTSGLHWIYYDGATLLESVNPSHATLDDLILNKVRVGLVYWNATDGAAYIAGDERHGPVMSGADHEWKHDILGAQWVSGFDLSDYALNSDADVDVAFEVTDGLIYDEDLDHSIEDGNPATQYEQQLSAGKAEIPILYRDDVDGSWTEDAATTLPYKHSGANRLAFNNDDGDGTWSQVEVDNNKFVLATLVATNDWQYPIKMVQGQAQYATKTLALEGADAEQIAWGDMPSPEIVILFRFVMQTNTGFGGTNNCKIISIIDLRRLSLTGGAVAPPQPHPILSDTHPDTVAGTVVRGDLVIGNATPAWTRLPLGGGKVHLISSGLEPVWSALDISDDTTPKLGGELDCNGNNIDDNTRAYVGFDSQVYVSEGLGVGTLPNPNFACAMLGSASAFVGIFGAANYEGNQNSAAGLQFVANHKKTDPTGDQRAYGAYADSNNYGIADAGQGMDAYGLWARGSNISPQDQVTGNAYAYGVFCHARAGIGNNTAGNFYGYSVFALEPTAPAGAPTTHEEWAGMFLGDVQVISDKKLILEGSATVKGDTYLIYDSAGLTMDFFHSGVKRLSIGVTDFRVPTNDGIDYDPGGDGDVDLVTVKVTGTPKLWWDESEDEFAITKHLNIAGGWSGTFTNGDDDTVTVQDGVITGVV